MSNTGYTLLSSCGFDSRPLTQTPHNPHPKLFFDLLIQGHRNSERHRRGKESLYHNECVYLVGTSELRRPMHLWAVGITGNIHTGRDGNKSNSSYAFLLFTLGGSTPPTASILNQRNYERVIDIMEDRLPGRRLHRKRVRLRIHRYTCTGNCRDS